MILLLRSVNEQHKTINSTLVFDNDVDCIVHTCPVCKEIKGGVYYSLL